MKVYNSEKNYSTRGFSDMLDITGDVASEVKKAEIKNGTVTVFTPGSTAGVTTIEYESGVIQDLKDAIERMAPADIHYRHDARWGDGNGFAHVRSALVGPSLSVPVIDGRVQLGTWQQVILIDFDNTRRKRRVLFQVMGE